MMKFLNKKRKLGNKGFSLVELIIVIAIMAVLVAVLAPQYIKYVEKSRVAVDDTFMSELKHNTEVLIADIAIYDLIATDDTVTWTSSTGAIESTVDELEAELESIVGTTYDPASKTYEDGTYTITITIAADGGITTAGAWADS